MLVLYLCSAFLLLTSMSATKFTDCDDADAKVTKLEIQGCDDDSQDTCEVQSGNSYTYTITFTSAGNYDKVYFFLLGSRDKIYNDDQNPDLCLDDLTCPLETGQEVTFSNSLEASAQYTQDVNAEFFFTDGESVIACASVNFTIASA